MLIITRLGSTRRIHAVRPVYLALVLLALVAPSHSATAAQPTGFPGKQTDWHGFQRYDFEVDGKPVLVVAPKQPAAGKPWVWHGEFFGHKPEPDVALLKQGFHIVYMRVPDMLGAPPAVAHWNAFYKELTQRYGFAKKAALVGLSRGGLYCYNWAAANPDKVACIYGDAPVCDFKSWPGGKGKGKGSPRDWKLVLETYGFPDEAAALAYDKNPIDQLAPLAAAKVPLLHVYGDADEVVPWAENTGVIAERYRKLGGSITLIAKPGVGHHPHGLDDPTPIVEFIARHAAKGMPQSATSSQTITAMEKIADLALIPPKLNTSPLPEYDYDKLDYGMTIGMERTPGGRLWSCWVAGGDSPKAFFVLATSDDDGETWSKPRLVVDAHAKDLPAERSVLVGNLWTDPLGRLWLIFDQSMDMFDGRAGVWVSVCDNPDASEPSWSEPRRIWHGVTLNKPTVLSTGEWMLPISLDQRPGFRQFKGCFQELDHLRGANVFVSADKGATWERRGCVQFPNPDWHEHMIVERKDGSLWMLARTAKGLMQSTSTDEGRTWTEPSDSAIKHPVARFHIRRLASGRILLIKHGRSIDAHEGRSMLTAWLSEDEGQTWLGGLMLDERQGISYPDGVQAPDGTLYISYDRNRSTDGEILLARFTEQDILARKLVRPKSKLKMLISRPLARNAQ